MWMMPLVEHVQGLIKAYSFLCALNPFLQPSNDYHGRADITLYTATISLYQQPLFQMVSSLSSMA